MKNKYFKYDPKTRIFFCKDNKNGNETALGGIQTRKGGLTRRDKLTLIHADGGWVLL